MRTNIKKYVLLLIILIVISSISILYSAFSNTTENVNGVPQIHINTVNNEKIINKDSMLRGAISVDDGEYYNVDNLDIQIRVRGNQTSLFPKKAYQFKLDNKENLYGIAEGKGRDWILLADYDDQSGVRNYYSLSISKLLNHMEWTPAIQLVELYINDGYEGAYYLTEKVETGKNRIRIDDSKAESNVDIGYLLNMTHYGEGVFFEIDDKQYQFKSKISENPNLRDEQTEYISNYLKQCLAVLESQDMNRIESMIDVDSLIDYYLLEEVTKNLDVGWDSFYLYKKQNGKLYFGPGWDFDLSCGQKYDMNCKSPEGLFACSDNMEDSTHEVPWFVEAVEIPEIRKRILSRWNEIRVDLSDILTTISTDEILINVRKRDYDKWNQGRSEMSYFENLQWCFVDWMNERIEWLDESYNSELFLGDNFKELYNKCE